MNELKTDTVLIVEDEEASLRLLASYFSRAGYNTLLATNSQTALLHLKNHIVDVVLLDINLPGKDGLALLRENLIPSGVGVILVTSKKEDIDKIVGLELGADDYVTKPYVPRELIVRVQNLIKRLRQSSAPSMRIDSHPSSMHFGDWSLDVGRRVLSNSVGKKSQLTEGEFKLLFALLSSAGEVKSRDQLMQSMEGRDWFPTDRSIDVLVARIRKKLGDNSQSPKYINTAHGTGYIFISPVKSQFPVG